VPVAALVRPAHCSIPESVETDGPAVAKLAEMVGFGPDPEQALALDALFAVDRFGGPAAFELAVVCSRQNLKTGLFKQAALGWLFLTRQRLVVWSAHEFRTAVEAFRDMTELIEGCEYTARQVKHIHRASGNEAIELVTGQRLIFKARTKGGGRGLTGDKVVLDEAFALQPMHMGALLPTLSAVAEPQVVYGSSAGLAESEVLRGIRNRGRAGLDRSLAYIEWCAPDGGCASPDCSHALGVEGCALDDEGNWRAANPALGRRITVEHIRAERRALPPAEFARERLGWWDDPAAQFAGLPIETWAAQAGADGRPDGRVAFALSASWPHAEMGSIAVVGWHGDEVYAQLVEHKDGTSWMPARVRELADEWNPVATILDDKDPASREKAALEKAGVELTSLNMTEVTQAYGMLIAAVMGDAPYLRHYDQPDLNAAVESARKREVGDAHTWTRKGPNDISPIVAVTHALFGLATHGGGQFFGAWR